MIKSRKLLHDIQTLISQNRIGEASYRLRKIPSPHRLAGGQLLEYLNLMRRVGAYSKGLRVVQRLESASPELRMEESILLGELGALSSAARKLEEAGSGLPSSLQLSALFHLGNIYSLQHRYPDAIQCFERMQNVALTSDPYSALIAKLNLIGSRIYLGDQLESDQEEISRFDRQELSGKYALLSQGAKYFSTLALMRLGRVSDARKALNQAFAIGIELKRRESLLLKLARLELDILEFPDSVSTVALTRIRKEVFSQPHIVYFDQLNALQARLAYVRGQLATARRKSRQVVYGGRRHTHSKDLLRFQQGHGLQEEHLYWRLEGSVPSPVSRNAVSREGSAPRQLPFLTSGPDQKLILNEGPAILGKLILFLASRLDFGARGTEIWDEVWETPYLSRSSPPTLRQSIHRLRNTGLGNFLELRSIGFRCCLSLNEGVRLITRG